MSRGMGETKGATYRAIGSNEDVLTARRTSKARRGERNAKSKVRLGRHSASVCG